MNIVRRFLVSLGHALRGIDYVIRNEHNARIHLLAAAAIIVAGAIFDVGAEGFAALLVAIAMVFFAEIVNTAVEKILDLVHPDHDERVGYIKDVAAGAVLVASVAALIIGVVVFFPILD